MKIDNSSEEEANLRLLKDAREDVVMARQILRIAFTQFKEGIVSGDIVSKELTSVKNAMTKAIEVETYLAKHSGEKRNGGYGANQLDLVDARREILDRLAKIAETR